MILGRLPREHRPVLALAIETVTAACSWSKNLAKTAEFWPRSRAGGFAALTIDFTGERRLQERLRLQGGPSVEDYLKARDAIEPERRVIVVVQSTRRLHQAVLECLAANESTYKLKPSVALKRHQSLNDLDVQDDDVALADASEQVPANDPAENAVAVAVN